MISLQLSHFVSQIPHTKLWSKKTLERRRFFRGIFRCNALPIFLTPPASYIPFSPNPASCPALVDSAALVPPYISTAARPPGSHLLHPTTTTFHRRPTTTIPAKKTLIRHNNIHDGSYQAGKILFLHLLRTLLHHLCFFLLPLVFA